MIIRTTLFLLLPMAAFADWTSVHYDETHNAVVNMNAVVSDLTVGPQWSTGAQLLRGKCRPIIGGNLIYTVATQSSPDRIWIKSFDKNSGTLQDESADLETGNSVSFDSFAAPALDVAGDALYFVSGSTAVRLKASDLTTNWSTTLSDSNTATGAHYGFVNASVARGEGKIFVKTYDASFGTTGSQVVALDETTGSVSWYAISGGRGSHTPLFADLGTQKLVIVERQPNGGEVGFLAFDANSTGEATPVWTSSWTAIAGGGFHGVWGDPMLHNGVVYAATSDFTDGRLLAFNAADGTSLFDVAIPATDIPPAVINGELIVLDGSGNLRRHNLTSGALIDSASIASFTYRNCFAATNDAIYVGTGSLQKITPQGVVESTWPGSTFDTAITIDSNTGHVYAIATDGTLNVFTNASSVGEWGMYQ